MSYKLVSVVIPTYDRPDKLTRAINSVLNQTYENYEVIIVDDNNPDTLARLETEKVMEQYKHNNKVKYVKHLRNKNGSAARNTGFNYSTGEYIMFLDDDDKFLPNKMKKQVECLESKDETWGACYTRYKRIRDGKLDTRSAENKEGNLYFDELCRNLFIQAGSNLMIRRKAFEDINGFDESFKRNQDIEMTVRLLKKYKLAYTDEMGLVYFRQSKKEKRNFDLVKITKHYLDSFSTEINQLSSKEKKIFDTLINLQLFRYKVVTERKLKEGINFAVEKKLNTYVIFRYFLHLAYRKIFKKSMGFDLKYEWIGE